MGANLLNRFLDELLIQSQILQFNALVVAMHALILGEGPWNTNTVSIHALRAKES